MKFQRILIYKKIKKNAFSYTKIEEFIIPSKVTKISAKTLSHCQNIQIIEISEESKLLWIPKSAFEDCHKLIIMIPPSLKKLISTINSSRFYSQKVCFS